MKFALPDSTTFPPFSFSFSSPLLIGLTFWRKSDSRVRFVRETFHVGLRQELGAAECQEL
ncbi:hypothetical protein MYCTH_2308272 [Thermothelomyces thermophilus ATCC 42464]|uniref:Uncharacterized protein n=1 Tax=Thermothelomyces thermophilus (strain ATCC 42464 / BCRC 31852 / DSM 1799) TaxID=573729 RepID=G2QJJ7_THET4|nr:uncharacterized protein MYCTH_2308272 [Thermothelomyces thermophilus ATCC 42464]AEO59754.1 hypothetical protein MYCTH_2308272 [Thermothelomyces thermophilus ATCC 42464]